MVYCDLRIVMQSMGDRGVLPASAAAQLARGLYALGGTDVKQLGAQLEGAALDVPAAEAQEAEELDVSYVRSKGTSVLFGPLVKCATEHRCAHVASVTNWYCADDNCKQHIHVFCWATS